MLLAYKQLSVNASLRFEPIVSPHDGRSFVCVKQGSTQVTKCLQGKVAFYKQGAYQPEGDVRVQAILST